MQVKIKNILIILLITVLLLFISAEVYLRYFGLLSLSRPAFSMKNIPTPVCRPDPQLGWINKAGVYTALPSSAGDIPIIVTINNDGSRATTARGADTGGHRNKIILVGCSVMFGEGLSDEQTMGWKIGQMLPEMDVLNYGVKGYSTYQSLLMLEKVMSGITKPAVVIYGFIAHHIDRNVAPEYWRALLNFHSRQKVSVPYITLNQGRELLRHNPELPSSWLVSNYLVTFRLIEILINQKKFLDSNNTEKHTIMQLLLLGMRDLCQAHGCTLIVAMFTPQQTINDLYSRFCRINHIPVINFDLDSIRDEPPLIPGEGHPNETVNALWAEQTANFLSGLTADGKKAIPE